MRTLTCEPQIEVIGSNVLSLLENLQADEIRPYTIKHNLDKIELDQWYPLTNWLNLMNDLAEETNLSSNLVAIGIKLAEKVNLPPHMKDATFHDILMSWDDIYHHQHRGGEIGHHHVEQVEDNYYVCTFTDVYPDDFKYGLAYGFARRFLPKGTPFNIRYRDAFNRMDLGGAENTIMEIKWD